MSKVSVSKNEQNDELKEASGLCSTAGNCSGLISDVKPFSVWGAKSQTCDNSIFSLETTRSRHC